MELVQKARLALDLNLVIAALCMVSVEILKDIAHQAPGVNLLMERAQLTLRSEYKLASLGGVGMALPALDLLLANVALHPDFVVRHHFIVHLATDVSPTMEFVWRPV